MLYLLKSYLLLYFIIGENKYKSTYLPELIDQAEVIAYCEIVKLNNDNSITIDVCQFLKGGGPSNELSVARFENWTCAGRWAAYKVGQKELIYLVKDKSGITWNILGAGNEGEMPIDNSYLYYSDPYLNLDLNRELYKVQDVSFLGYKYKLSDVEYTIKNYERKRLFYYSQAKSKLPKGKNKINAFEKRLIEELRSTMDK